MRLAQPAEKVRFWIDGKDNVSYLTSFGEG